MVNLELVLDENSANNFVRNVITLQKVTSSLSASFFLWNRFHYSNHIIMIGLKISLLSGRKKDNLKIELQQKCILKSTISHGTLFIHIHTVAGSIGLPLRQK